MLVRSPKPIVRLILDGTAVRVRLDPELIQSRRCSSAVCGYRPSAGCAGRDRQDLACAIFVHNGHAAEDATTLIA
jgi:hypothetical protein